MIKNCLCVLGLSLGLGCATAVVRPYVGEQQSWPTANGAICSVRYDLPVFNSLPPAPYEVLAELRINSPLFAQPEEGHLSTLVKKSVQIGADALVFVDGQIFFSTQYGVRSIDPGTAAPAKKSSIVQVNRFNPESFRPGVTIIAIRWVNEPPVGLPPRYAKYSAKMLADEPPLAPEAAPITESPTIEPSPAEPATDEAPRANLEGNAAPTTPPPAAPAISEPPKSEAPTEPPASATPETPTAETNAPALTTPNLYMPATPAAPAAE